MKTDFRGTVRQLFQNTSIPNTKENPKMKTKNTLCCRLRPGLKGGCAQSGKSRGKLFPMVPGISRQRVG